MKLSHLSETLIGSEIVKLGNEISDRIRQGEKIYNYTIGDFNPSIFPIPAELEEAIVDAYRTHRTNYPPADGIAELRQAVSAFIAKYLGLEYNTGEILIAAGGRPLIYTVYRAIVDEGDSVIYPVPSWNNNHYTHFNHGKHVEVQTSPENFFLPTADEIRPHVKDAVLLALCSPLNPTGTAYTRRQLEAICDLVIEENKRRGDNEKKLYVLYDQIYWTLTMEGITHCNPVSLRPEMRPYTIFVDGISKSFAATGVRVGWAMGPSEILGKMKAINSHVGAWSPMAEQYATAKFLGQTEAVERFLSTFKAAIAERLHRIYNGFSALKAEGFAVDAITPQAAIYLTVKLDLKGKHTADGRILSDQQDVTAYLLNEAKLALVPFYCFGAGKDSAWYRLSIGTCRLEDLDAMLASLKAALEKLN